MKGVVVAPEPFAAEVGADVLRAGGNAFDADATRRRGRGAQLRQPDAPHASFARPQTVMLTSSGYAAASDPRSDGGAAMFSVA